MSAPLLIRKLTKTFTMVPEEKLVKKIFCPCTICKNCNFESETEKKLCLACKSGIHKR